MNCKHVRKISVIPANILKRDLRKSSNPSHHHEFNSEFHVSKGKLNLLKGAIQTKPLPSSEVWSRIGLSSDTCKSPGIKFLGYNPPYKYDQRRNYSSLLEKIKNFIMSAFNGVNSAPLLKAGEPTEPKKDQANKPKASASSPTATSSKSDSPQTPPRSMLQSPKSKSKEKSEETGQKLEVKDERLETEGGITAKSESAEDKRRDLVAESLMKETAQRLEIENKRKPPFKAEKGHFAEDRIATEMPKKRREKIKLEQDMKEERIEEAKEAEVYKVQEVKKAPAIAKKLDASKLCEYDDVFCGVEQYDDVKGGEIKKREGQAAQILAAKKTKEKQKKTTQVFTSKGQVKPTGLVPKRKPGDGFEKNYSTSAITLEAKLRTDTPDFFTSKRRNKIGSIKQLEKHDETLQKMCLKDSMFSKLASENLYENILDRNAKSSWTLTVDEDIDDKTPMIIQRDPLEIFEQKEPKPAIEVREPNTSSCELIEPINKEPFKDPFLGRLLIAKGTKNIYEKDAKEKDKKEDATRKKEEKTACKKENRQMVIEEPCSQNKPRKPLCCYNPPKRLLEIDLTDKCNAKCAVAPQKPPPVMDCSLCKKYDTLEDDVPKPKPMVCMVRKCSKPLQECPPSASQASKSTKPSKRTELCAGPCPKMESAMAKAKAKQSSTDPRSKQKCTQEKCFKKEKTKPVVCPSMPKACMPKPKETQAKECKKKTCSTINTASKMEEAKKKKKEIEKKRELEKKCNPKKKKPGDTCKILSDCEKQKLKAEEDNKRKAEEDAKKSLDPKAHTEWKAVAIKGSGKWCDKEGAKQHKEEPITKSVMPKMEKKYQSPRYKKKPVCDDSKPSTAKDEDDPKGRKKCIPIGIMDASQSLGTIENSLYHNNVFLASNDGNEDERDKKGPAIPPPALAEKSKSDSEIL